MEKAALNFVKLVRLIPVDFVGDSLAFVDDEVMYWMANKPFVAVKRKLHKMMMNDDKHPVRVVANCNRDGKKRIMYFQIILEHLSIIIIRTYYLSNFWHISDFIIP